MSVDAAGESGAESELGRGARVVQRLEGAAVGVLALVLATWVAAASADLVLWVGLVAFAWLFHVGVDRALGYGLKHPDHFQHTHLGWIGRRSQ